LTAKTLPVRLKVQNAENRLFAGMTVFAEIRVVKPDEAEVLSVPVAAVQRVDREWCVFIPRGKGLFERRPIARGRDLGTEIEVLGGLAVDEEVVVEGAFVLRSETLREED
jgi:multidrug efflux pump subunit AcrA (membrane-fusion protein)